MTPDSSQRNVLPPLKRSVKFLLLCALLVQSAPVWSQGLPPLQLSAQKVSEGFITLSWNELGEPQPVTVQVSTDPQAQQLVRSLSLQGQSQVHLSGFDNGVYFARLLNRGDVPLTRATRFEVQHRALSDAMVLFAIGAGLFVFLMVTLLRFTRS